MDLIIPFLDSTRRKQKGRELQSQSNRRYR